VGVVVSGLRGTPGVRAELQGYSRSPGLRLRHRMPPTPASVRSHVRVRPTPPWGFSKHEGNGVPQP
jgi:hypothetical protein